jgi:hypothetical protein
MAKTFDEIRAEIGRLENQFEQSTIEKAEQDGVKQALISSYQELFEHEEFKKDEMQPLTRELPASKKAKMQVRETLISYFERFQELVGGFHSVPESMSWRLAFLYYACFQYQKALTFSENFPGSEEKRLFKKRISNVYYGEGKKEQTSQANIQVHSPREASIYKELQSAKARITELEKTVVEAERLKQQLMEVEASRTRALAEAEQSKRALVEMEKELNTFKRLRESKPDSATAAQALESVPQGNVAQGFYFAPGGALNPVIMLPYWPGFFPLISPHLPRVSIAPSADSNSGFTPVVVSSTAATP